MHENMQTTSSDAGKTSHVPEQQTISQIIWSKLVRPFQPKRTMSTTEKRAVLTDIMSALRVAQKASDEARDTLMYYASVAEKK